VADLVKSLTDEIDPPDGFTFQVSQFHQSNARQRFFIRATKTFAFDCSTRPAGLVTNRMYVPQRLRKLKRP